jgi:hypothetical protein
VVFWGVKQCIRVIQSLQVIKFGRNMSLHLS